MSWKGIRYILRELFDRNRLEKDSADELQFHMEMQTAENIRTGMSPEEAKRKAILDLGGLEQTKERIREQYTGNLIQTIWRDVIFGVRMLRHTPGFTFTAILTLALGIGASVCIFSIVHAVLLQPLPYPHPDQLVQIWDTNPKLGIEQTGGTTGNLKDWKFHARLFQGIAGYYTMGRTLTVGNDSKIILTSQVTSDFFNVLNQKPLLGRFFTTEESNRALFNNAAAPTGTDPVAILSYRIWRDQFGSDAQIIGQKIILERQSWRIVGVMPKGFAMPSPDVDAWIPWSLEKDLPRDQHYVNVIARLKEGVHLTAAENHLNGIAAKLGEEFPLTNKDWKVRLVPLQDQITGKSRRLLWVLLGAVGVLLLISCVNIALLQLARATGRTQEAAVRLAMGASRARLIRQFLVENLVLGFVGGTSGFLIALFAIEQIKILQWGLPRIEEISINPSVLFFSLAVTIFSVICFGLAPALTATRVDTAQVFRGTSPRNTAGSKHVFARNLLVVMEVALALILLAGAGLLVESFIHLRKVPQGFQPRNVLVLPIFLDMEKYKTGVEVRSYYKQLMEQLGALPGVESVGGATALPSSPLGADFERPVWPQEHPTESVNAPTADVRMITTDYFQTLGIRLVQGRGFRDQDGVDAPRVVIINQKLSSLIWPGENAVGKKLVVDASQAGTSAYEVVGVANNIRFRGPRSEPRSEIFLAHAQRPYLILNMAVRTKDDPRFLIAPVREIMRQIDPMKPAYSITPLEDLVGATMKSDRYAMMLITIFAFVAVVLAVLGVYGLLTYRVRQQLPEIGIRIALGASQNQILRWILSEGFRLACAGIVIGLLASLFLTRLLAGLLFGITPNDPVTFVWVSALLLGSVSIACIVPAFYATRIDPAHVLRSS